MGRMSARNAYLGTVAPLEAGVFPPTPLTPGTCGGGSKFGRLTCAELFSTRTGYFNRMVGDDVSDFSTYHVVSKYYVVSKYDYPGEGRATHEVSTNYLRKMREKRSK